MLKRIQNVFIHSLFKRILFCCLLALLVFSGIFQHISDSEFWPISLSRFLGDQQVNHPVLLYKLLFHVILKIPFFFGLTSVEHLIFVRVMFSVIGVMSLTLYYLIAKRIYRSRWVALTLVILLISCLFYFSQWSRIRSDFISLFFCLLGIEFSFRWPDRKMKFAILLVDPFLMILATPKAIYWILILLVFCWPGLAYLSLPFIGISLVFLITTFVFGSHIFTEAYTSAIFYFLISWSSMLRELQSGFSQLVYFLESHFVQLAVGFSGAFCFYLKNRNIKNKVIFVFILSLIFIILHPQKVPFFIGALLPFLILPGGYFILSIDHATKKYFIIFLFAFTVQSILTSKASQWWHNNQMELTKISELETLMSALPGSTYFDGIGVLPRQKMIDVYLGPEDPVAIEGAVHSLQSNHPTFIFRNSRSFLAEPFFSIEILKYYTQVRNGVFIRRELAEKVTTDLSGRPLQLYFSFDPSY